MKKIAAVSVLLSSLLLLGGCAYAVGGALGAGGTATGYEVHLDNERDRVEKLYKDGKIDKREYEIRLDQIRRDSAIQ
ncbi:hypothetical protein AAFN88_10245 [Pelagibius sp. CAU 1746]|uniref:hypothetical protein n=1 Tax=Pelagibius sp. CAU 1746 TaxID=3140370 RepID=UPI00325A887E